MKQRCPICGSEIISCHTCSRGCGYQPEKGKILNPKPPKGGTGEVSQEKWEEEFEDDLGMQIRLKSVFSHIIDNLGDYLNKFNLLGKVKIKARKGKIVIEKIQE